MTTTHVPRDKERSDRAATRFRLPRPRAGRLPAADRGVAAPLHTRRLPWVLGSLVCAAWAGSFPLVSDLGTQRTWGVIAGIGYLLAACAAAFLPRRHFARTATGLAFLGAIVLPMALMLVKAWSQSEVPVVQYSAAQMLHTGSPYLPDPHQVNGYDPYLPAMALFGIPRVLLGHAWWLPQVLSDARVWFLAVFTGCLVGAWRLLGPLVSPRVPACGVALAAVTASPLVALVADTGGVDLPLIGCCLLGLAFAGRGYAARAGLALGLACAIKWTAWPALPVALLLLSQLYGRRAVLRCTAVSLTLAGVLIAPGVLITPHAVLEQVIRFPLGLSSVRTPADSPLPGHLLAQLGPGGRLASFALLALGGALVTLWLVLRPPRSVTAAADRLAAGVAVAFLLAPAGRFGYLELPILLVLWPRLATRAAELAAEDDNLPAAEVPLPVRS
ncbi:glycosyltransferase 87 family protein [Streptacidiphilus sp. EB129]|uniref:glycosyltransferase 87 family protein n=1 Tax=Streptacidiphilus sp. EB129 TaxID=3156262 RepID=UPI003514501F